MKFSSFAGIKKSKKNTRVFAPVSYHHEDDKIGYMRCTSLGMYKFPVAFFTHFLFLMVGFSLHSNLNFGISIKITTAKIKTFYVQKKKIFFGKKKKKKKKKK